MHRIFNALCVAQKILASSCWRNKEYDEVFVA